MNPLVAEYIGLMPVSPIDYVWFDATQQSGFMDSYADWWNSNLDKIQTHDYLINELAMPFDKMAMMISIASKETMSNPGMMPIVFERKGSTLFVRQYIKGLPKPSIETTLQDYLYHNSAEKNLKCSIRFSKEYLKAIGKTKEDQQEIDSELNTIEHVLKKLILICYGIPSQGAKVNGYKLSCSQREEQRNAKKRIKGKCQLFEWKTVELKTNPLPKEYVPLGGTHASPKPHDRRGHQRRYKNGKVVYVKSTTINKHKIETDGFIQHDYKIQTSKPKKGLIQTIVEGVKNLFKEKKYECVSKA